MEEQDRLCILDELRNCMKEADEVNDNLEEEKKRENIAPMLQTIARIYFSISKNINGQLRDLRIRCLLMGNWSTT